ncbi:hypothetical protein GCK32_002072 [Trichostrongylus colubriformis]|uniref:G-protein coupled receptors family 1 profile domain-containing protein n=1 Tax=Trichostrongylus colubriformis TaxID=6319 RepID=A0AAN8G3L0_TRICO
MTLSASQLLFGHWLRDKDKTVAGYLALSLQYSSIYTSIAMTVNRLVAVNCPQKYSKWFGRKNTVMYIIACWLIAWVHNAVHLEDGCSFTFQAETCQFEFSNEQCGRTLSLYQDLIYNVIIAIVSTLVDIYCLLQLNYKKEMIAYSVNRRKREKPWFLQTILNSIFYVSMLGSFHVAVFFEETSVRFILTVAAWQLWLLSGPLMIICTDEEYRTPFRSFRHIKTTTEVTTAF